jgi:hypothetical protein
MQIDQFSRAEIDPQDLTHIPAGQPRPALGWKEVSVVGALSH